MKVYEIPAASCSSSIQAVDDNEETNSSNGEAQILSEMGITSGLPISIEQEAEQDAEIQDEDF